MAANRSRRIVLVIAACLLVPLSACSGSSDATGPAKVPSKAATTTTTAASGPLAAYVDYKSVSYDDADHWLCRPDKDDDPCDVDLDRTVVEADGTLTPGRFTPADPERGVDCFYVYPTISNDKTSISDWEPGTGEEIFVTQNQAVQVQSACRLFVPIYRQITNAGLAGKGEGAVQDKVPYGDVLDAFKTYLAEDNDGRGFVLLGHSQGSLWLTRLIDQVVEEDPDLLRLFVGAYIPGTDIRVPEGEAAGATFDTVPLCERAGQVGCVTTWSSFDAGRGPATTINDDGEMACVHPGTVAGQEGGALEPVFPSGAAGLVGGAWVEGDDTPLEGAYAWLPGIATGTCSESSTSGFFDVSIVEDPDNPRVDQLPLYAGLGANLHLIDMTLAIGNVVDSIEHQIDEYTGAN